MNYKFSYKPGTNNTLIISISSKGANAGDNVTPEFDRLLTSYGCHIGFALDMKKTWFNRQETFDGIRAAIDRVQEDINPQKTVFLGLSMGGFGAILFSKYCVCTNVVALSPQIDLTAPWDNRYERYYKEIPEFIFPTVLDCFVDTTQYDIVVGRSTLDAEHVNLIPNQANINIHRLPHPGHSPIDYWKNNGTLFEELRSLISPI